MFAPPVASFHARLSPPLLACRTVAATLPATHLTLVGARSASLAACSTTSTLSLQFAAWALVACHAPVLPPMLPLPWPLRAASDGGDWDSLSPVCASGLTYMNEAEAMVSLGSAARAPAGRE